MKYLIIFRGIFYYRQRIPLDLRPHFANRDYIKRSLKTRQLKDAKTIAKMLTYKTEKLFFHMRSGMLSKKQIKELVSSYYNETINEMEESRAEGHYSYSERELKEPITPLGSTLDELNMETLKSVQADQRQALTTADYSGISHIAKLLLTEKGLVVDEQSTEFKSLCRECLKASIDIIQYETDTMYGDYSKREETSKYTPTKQPVEPVSSTSKNSQKAITLEQLSNEYLRDVSLNKGVKEKTQKEYESIFRTVFRVIDKDTLVSDIDRTMMLDLKETLKKLPANLHHNKAYRDRPIDEILSMPIKKPRAQRSVEKMLDKMSGLFQWGIKSGMTTFNPAHGLRDRDRRKDSEQKDAYTVTDLETWFTSKIYTEDKYNTKPYHLWLPLLAAYSGLRMNELCQLYVDDVYKVEEVYVFDINENREDQQLKNRNSTRLVPIHSLIIESGFLKYVETVKASGEVRIFHQLSRKHYEKYSDTYSRQLAPIRKELGFIEKKDFHSFRHTFTSALKFANVPETIAGQLVGHAGGETITYTRYGKGHPLDQLKEAVEKVNYDINLETLESLKTKLRSL